MPKRSYQWTAYDYVASNEIKKLLKEKHLTTKRVEELTQGKITYGRIFDIYSKRHAPVQLSEFIQICSICKEDPTKLFDKILKLADRINAEQEHEQQINKLTNRTPEDLSADMTLAANTDPNKKEESEYEDWGA